MDIKIKIMRLDGAKLPSYAHKGDSGVDIYSNEEFDLKPMQRRLVSTGLKIAIPFGYEAQIRPKSGLAVKHGIGHVNSVGTIDSGYRGEIKVAMINFGQESYKVKAGKKIGQMVFAKVAVAEFEEVRELEATSRNEGGFGSTGLD
jgi:dUTP pyrophosphatase